MFEAGDFPAGSDGAQWSTSQAKRRRGNGVSSRHTTKQYANYQGQPRPGEREEVARLDAGKGLGPSPKPGSSHPPMMHENAAAAGHSAAPNLGKHEAADIHTTAEKGKDAPALRGAPRTVSVKAGRDTNRGSNKITYTPSRRP